MKWTASLAGSSVSANPRSLIFYDFDPVSFGWLLDSSLSSGDIEVNACFMASPSTDELCLGEAPQTLEKWSSPGLMCLGNEIYGITSKGWTLENFNQVHCFSELALISSF